MKQKGSKWDREETIIVLDLYFRIPFAKSSKTHPKVVETAEIIGRSPSSVNLKIGNFGSLDPTLKEEGIKGLENVSMLDRKIWKEFEDKYHDLAHKSQELKTSYVKKSAPQIERQKTGRETLEFSKRRIGQNFFRDSILASYNGHCCITGLQIEQLLVASHIKPWVKSTKYEKLNPKNGICLNALHDRAFDRGLVTITPEHKVKISNILKKSPDRATKPFFEKYDGKQIDLPARLPPDKNFLAWHQKNVFIDD